MGKQRTQNHDESKIEENEQQQNVNEKEQQSTSQEKNVWCPYYQYGCKTYFPKSQTQNHLCSAYREHLIIQIAEMYKLVNLIIRTISAFPTFDHLMQQPPINTNNETVSNAIQYLSQYNAH